MKIGSPVNHTLIVAAMLSAAVPLAARGATATATIAVTATVFAACTISANALPFGTYTGGVNNATTTVTPFCTLGTPYTVSLDAGTGAGATVAARKMTLSSNTLTYSLYSDSAHSVVWGTTIGTNTVAGTGSGLGQPLTVYGQIPASQNVQAGNYTDTVTATLTY